MSRRVAVLGSTGSIGRQALDLIRRNRDRFEVVGLSSRSNLELLADQAREFRAQTVVVSGSSDDEGAVIELRELLAAGSSEHLPEIRAGQEGLESLAADESSDTVLNGVVGAAGLRASLATLKAGKRLALANKESLVAGGELVRSALSEGGGEIIPVDSEHAGLAQCLRAGTEKEVARVVVTASGGPFRGWTRDQLESVTPEEALKHPTWEMGAKITVDSATLMNKGLEAIEAHVLFEIDYDSIGVVVHPQSVVHAMVEFVDGSTIAQLAMPDMENPIGFALNYPERLADPVGRIDWATVGALTFELPDTDTFRCLPLAFEAGKAGGNRPCILNAANEEAVAAFLAGKLKFLSIPDVISETLETVSLPVAQTVDDLENVEREARRAAGATIDTLRQTRGR